MSFFDDLIKGAGDFLEGASYAVIISKWQEKGGNAALNDIEAFVKRSTPEMINAMDSHLLNSASTNYDSQQRRELTKFYAFFKLVEFNTFQKWRGFPS